MINRLFAFIIIAVIILGCSAPFLEVQVTQRVNTQSSDDPISIDSELQGSKRTKTSTSSPKINEPTLNDIAEEVNSKVIP